MPELFCNVEFKFTQLISQRRTVASEILILKIEMLLEFQNKANTEIIDFYLMHFGFALDRQI